MGHLAGKDTYLRAARRLDSLTVRAPYDATLRAILEELFTVREAELVAGMPATPSTLARLQELTGLPRAELEPLLEGMCRKGLVIDLYFERQGITLYQVSPFVIGVFEFTMMRAGLDADHARRARLFNEYWERFMAANAEGFVALTRALPHEAALPHDAAQPAGDHVEILDYERASRLIEEESKFAVGICSCRHEKQHLGRRGCDTPLEQCTSLGTSADYLLRRGLARPISRGEMLERVERSRELGLVIATDNVQRRPGFICHCCSCCCNLIGALTKYGSTTAIVSSSFVARVDAAGCAGCARCVEACPIDAITLGGPAAAAAGARGPARVDEQVCIGCGVCATRCKTASLRLAPRTRRVFHPETTFERVILQALQAGTLAELVFDNPSSRAQGFLRGFVGGFLRLEPVKRALVSERLRSTFLREVARAARRRAGSGPSPVEL